MNVLKNAELEIEVHNGADEIVILWRGKSVEKDPGMMINPFLQQVISGRADKSICVDFRQLKQMNSSTMPPIILFMKLLGDAGISATFKYAGSINWQRVSFKMLETIAGNFKSISVVADE